MARTRVEPTGGAAGRQMHYHMWIPLVRCTVIHIVHLWTHQPIPALESGTPCPLSHEDPCPRDSVPHAPGLFLRVSVLMTQQSILQPPVPQAGEHAAKGTPLLEHPPFPESDCSGCYFCFHLDTSAHSSLIRTHHSWKHPKCPSVGKWTNKP